MLRLQPFIIRLRILEFFRRLLMLPIKEWLLEQPWLYHER